MIGDFDREWIIATAARCGSSRLRTALTQPAQKRPECPVAEYIKPWNGGKKEDVPQFDHRIFCAREPLERWNSLFYHYRNVREQPPLDGWYLEDFSNFMKGIANGECSHRECTHLTTHLERFDPHRALLLQNIDLLWSWIDAPFFWKQYYYHRSSSHSNSDKKPLEETLRISNPLPSEGLTLVVEEENMLRDLGAYDRGGTYDSTLESMIHKS
jgi:hypothetical protein